MIEIQHPIIFEYDIEVRFNDLDPYGHVNASVYLDYVVSSRWLFLEKKLGYTIKDIMRYGVGFLMRRSEIEYLKPILENQTVTVRSFIEKYEGSRLYAKFEILGQDKETRHSVGTLEFAVIDLKTGKRTETPDSLKPLFIEK